MPNPPMPLERRIALGNPGHRPMPTIREGLAKAVQDVAIPEHLKESGIALWNQVMASASTWLALSDLPTLTLLCEAADQRAELLAAVELEGVVTKADNGRLFANPALAHIDATEKRMQSLLGALGLTPTDRARLGLTAAKTEDKLQRFLQRDD